MLRVKFIKMYTQIHKYNMHFSRRKKNPRLQLLMQQTYNYLLRNELCKLYRQRKDSNFCFGHLDQHDVYSAAIAVVFLVLFLKEF